MAYKGEYFDSSKQTAASILGAHEQELECIQSYVRHPRQKKKLLEHQNCNLLEGIEWQCDRHTASRLFKPDKFEISSARLKGSGGSAAVYDVRHETLNRIAVKQFKNDAPSDDAWKELDSLIRLQHPCIIQLLGACTMGYPCILLELCIGSVHDLSDRMNIGEKYQVMINVAEGLQFLHSMRFAHSDLKPENILLRDNGRAVIADLGSGFFLGESSFFRSEFAVGTYAFMNLEALSDRKYSLETDCWSFGCIVYELEKNRRLFATTDRIERTEEIQIDFIQNGILQNGTRIQWRDRVLECQLHPIIFKLMSNHLVTPEEFLADQFARSLVISHRSWSTNETKYRERKRPRPTITFKKVNGFDYRDLEVANFYFDPSVANPKSSLEKYLVPVSSQMSLSSPTSGGCYKKILADREVFRTILQSVASKNTEQIRNLKGRIQSIIFTNCSEEPQENLVLTATENTSGIAIGLNSNAGSSEEMPLATGGGTNHQKQENPQRLITKRDKPRKDLKRLQGCKRASDSLRNGSLRNNDFSVVTMNTKAYLCLYCEKFIAIDYVLMRAHYRKCLRECM